MYKEFVIMYVLLGIIAVLLAVAIVMLIKISKRLKDGVPAKQIKQPSSMIYDNPPRDNNSIVFCKKCGTHFPAAQRVCPKCGTVSNV